MVKNRLITYSVLSTWSAAAALVLLLFLSARSPGAGGGEMAMLMFVLSFPGSIPAAMFLNSVEYLHFAPDLGFLTLLLVWLPFYIIGLLQWWVIGDTLEWCYQKWTARK